MKEETLSETIPDAMLESFKAGIASADPKELHPGLCLHHHDQKISDISEKLLDHLKAVEQGPGNPAGKMTVNRPESFAHAYGLYKEPRTRVFANLEFRQIVAFFDFLSKGSEETGWGQLQLWIHFEKSRKLKEWSKTTEWMGQEDFANFLEDHLEDIRDPSGQELLAIATDLEASSSGSFKGKRNLDNGTVTLAYQDEVETSVEIPRHLTLGIPLFEHGEPYKLGVRLRFQISGVLVKFRILFTNLEDALEQEFERIVQELEESIGETIIRGSLTLAH